MEYLKLCEFNFFKNKIENNKKLFEIYNLTKEPGFCVFMEGEKANEL